jgi:DEAD/DEAH box helicase-like protein
MSDKVFEVTYGQKGSSVNTDSLGMREMQARVYKKRNSKKLLVKAPPASGKSRALMFIALDKLHNQGIKKAIIAVPERSIGKSFASVKLSDYGFPFDWYVKPENNLTTIGSDRSKVEHFIKFMRSMDASDNVIIVTHATFRFAVEELSDADFDDTLVAIDEFHHVSDDTNSVLGEALRGIIKNSNAHVFAMTGSYFRGDSKPILSPEDELEFDRVTYTYYEQLEGYKYLKSFSMNYKFYQGTYTDAIHEVLPEFIDKKTIIHIPSVNSGESTKDKYGEVDAILDVLGTIQGQDSTSGIITIKTESGKLLKVADLVNEEGRDRVSSYLANMSELDDLDIIIALGMAKEGFDWPFAEYALTIGYRNSLTEVVQIIGRVTRDSSNKTTAQFTNLLAAPDAKDDEVTWAINNTMKAISASLLMENVLAPNYRFKPRTSPEQVSKEKDIYVKGIAEPSTPRTKEIIEQDLTELKATILQEDKIREAIAANEDTRNINFALIPRVIATVYPDLSNQEIEEVRQHVMADFVLTHAERDKENRSLIKMANKFINVNDLNIELIDSINPFQSAYEILSRNVDAKTLRLFLKVYDAKKYDFTEEDLKILYPQIKQFKQSHNRSPEKNLDDEYETKLYYALVKLVELRRERDNG